MLFGPIEHEEYKSLTDAKWQEKLACGILIAAIVIVGVAPFWLSDVISNSLVPFTAKMSHAITLTQP